MPLIKRYSNRKLYDTQKNRYINLEAIAQIIRSGDEVQVVDNTTGEDLTAVTLAQVIIEREKKERNFIPHTILMELIRTGGESLNSIRDKLTSPADLIQQVDQEITTRLESLIRRGEIAEEDGRKLLDKLLIDGNRLFYHPQFNDKDIEEALLKHGLSTRDDYEKLVKQAETLSEKLDNK